MLLFKNHSKIKDQLWGVLNCPISNAPLLSPIPKPAVPHTVPKTQQCSSHCIGRTRAWLPKPHAQGTVLTCAGRAFGFHLTHSSFTENSAFPGMFVKNSGNCLTL